MSNKYKLVPIEPTIEMLEADWMVTMSDAHTKHGVAYCAYKAMLEKSPPADIEPVGELRCDATTGHVYGVHWYERCSPAIGTKVYTHPPADKDAERIEKLEDCLDKIRSWCKAYPTTIFTEPNWDEVQEKLGKNLLCQVSGSNMRHVTTGIQKIIDATMGEAMGEVNHE